MISVETKDDDGEGRECLDDLAAESEIFRVGYEDGDEKELEMAELSERLDEEGWLEFFPVTAADEVSEVWEQGE